MTDYSRRVVRHTWLLFEEFRMSSRAKHIRTLLLIPFFTHNISLTSCEAVPERTLLKDKNTTFPELSRHLSTQMKLFYNINATKREYDTAKTSTKSNSEYCFLQLN